MTPDDETGAPPCIETYRKRRKRKRTLLIWFGGASLLALLIGQAFWLVRWLRNSADLPGSTAAGPPNYAPANSVSITFSHPVREQGIQLVILESDPTTPEVIEGVECHQLMRRPGTYAYFKIDPTFKRTNHFDLEAEVEYFDASRGRMRLQYDAWSPHRAQGRNYSSPRRVVTTGGREWKTNRFWMPDVRFENRLYGGADLRVEASGPDFYLRRITLRRAATVHDGPYAHSNAVSLTLGSDSVSHGLVLGHAPDSVKYVVVAAGQKCHAVNPGPTGSGYLYFAVDHAFKTAHPGPCSAEVEYYSPEPSRFRIEYDGEDNGQASEYKATATVTAVAGIWATNLFDLPTPRFKNAQNDEADFRLNTFTKQMFFRKVTLRPRE